MGAAGEQLAFDKGKSAAGSERPVTGARGFGTGDACAVQGDLLARLVAAQIVFDQPFGWLWTAVNNAQIAFLEFTGFDPVVQDTQRLGRFRGNYVSMEHPDIPNAFSCEVRNALSSHKQEAIPYRDIL